MKAAINGSLLFFFVKVLSKYLYSLIIGVLYLGSAFLVSLFNRHFEVISLAELSVAFLILSFFLSAHYPLKYLVKKGFAVFSFIGYFVVLSALVYSVYSQGEQFDYWGFQSVYDALSAVQVFAVASASSAAVLAASFKTSSYLYSRMDF